MDGDDETKTLPFAGREDAKRKSGALPDDDAEALAVAPGEAYATVTGQRQAISIEFIGKDGHSFTVPYSYRPLIWWHPPGAIIIEYPGLFSVALRGENLAGLARRIRDYRVIWVRESDGVDAPEGATVVVSIELIHAYPSRKKGK